MSDYWARGLTRTILEEETDEKKKGGFLDPWSSLIPDFTREKLSPDIIALFKENKTIIENFEKVDMPFWALLFPKRSYLPPEYPHLQMWYLGQNFAPSLQFVDLKYRKVLIKAVEKITDIYNSLFEEEEDFKNAKLGMAVNATPFSFIKNEEGKYYAGGQSVRTFHLHFLGVPQDLEKKELTEEEAVLVYPTTFAHQLLELIFSKSGVVDFIFKKENLGFQPTERGIQFEYAGEIKDLMEAVGRLDEFMYQVQLSLIFAFYQDSEMFLDKLADFARTNDLKEMKSELDDLILVGYERSLPVVKDLVNKEIHRLGRKYDANFDNEKIDTVVECLTTDEEGDLASYLGDTKVVLRPGMGYGTMIWVEDGKYEINIVPLDSLESEGTMESNGYYFTEKEVIHEKPSWLEKFTSLL